MNHTRATAIAIKTDTTAAHRTPTLVQSTCPYCGVGCGVDVTVKGDSEHATLTGLKGTPEHPANFGRLCVKGTNLLETNGMEGRLLQASVNGKRVTYDEATTAIADKMRSVIAEHGADAVAFYVSGQLLTEDYYVANKLMKGYIGSANIDTNSRLCMSSAVAAYKRAFGEDVVPCDYTDLEHTDCLVLVGSNTAWAHPVLFHRIERAKQRNPAMQVILIDPRATETATLCDLHLAIKPGTDAVLFNGLLQYLADQDALDNSFIEASTHGFNAALAAAQPFTIARVAEHCDVPVAAVHQFFHWFAVSNTAITMYSMGINQSSSGVDKGNAIINCHLASGKIGKAGCGPFSITGQPNAMGGREVGGLANMLAAHMDIENPIHRERVQRFWQSPQMCSKAGLKAVDLFDAMAEGKIKFVWIMATNPVVSMPNRNRVEAALRQCEMVVVSDIVAKNDTLAFADVILPATGWSEKNGTVTNSERRISRQRGMLAAPGDAKHDWQALCEVAQKLGFDHGFNYTHPADIFREHAALTAFENENERALNLGGFATISQQDYDRLAPTQWPVLTHSSNNAPASRLFADGQFYTADHKARFIAITPVPPQQLTTDAFPFVLNTGRSRDQWHTMTRTGKAKTLLQHAAHAVLSMHPQDLEKLNLRGGELVALTSSVTSASPVILPVAVDEQLRQGECFAPIHWSATWGSHCKVGALFTSAHDALSGQPELKHAAVAIKPAHFACTGSFACADHTISERVRACFGYWTTVPFAGGDYMQVASTETAAELTTDIRKIIPSKWVLTCIEGAYSSAIIATYQDSLKLCLWLGASTAPAPVEWLAQCFASHPLSMDTIASLLRQQPDEAFLLGPVVCSCFSVREKSICEKIADGGNTVEKLGLALKCGTNCGSCKPALQALITASATDTDEQQDKQEGLQHV